MYTSFITTLTCPGKHLAPAARRPVAFRAYPFSRGDARSVEPLTRIKGGRTRSFDTVGTYYDAKYMYATAHANGNPQQRSRRRLWPIRHCSMHAPPPRVCHQSSAKTRPDGSLRALQGGRRQGDAWERVRRSKQGVLGPKVARAACSQPPSPRHEQTSPQRGARERSLRARGGRERRAGGSARIHNTHGACPAAQLRLHGRWRS